jgi:hypothetical protein
MRFVEIILEAPLDEDELKLFIAVDSGVRISDLLACVKSMQPFRICTESRNRAALFKQLSLALALLDQRKKIKTILLNEGAPIQDKGSYSWEPFVATVQDVVDIAKLEMKMAINEECYNLFFRPTAEVIEAAVNPASQHGNYSKALLATASLPPNMQAVLDMLNHVLLGGFEFYFLCASGDHVSLSLLSLKLLGLQQTIPVVEKAVAVFDLVGGYSSDQKLRQHRMQRLPPSSFDDLTAELSSMRRLIRSELLKQSA